VILRAIVLRTIVLAVLALAARLLPGAGGELAAYGFLGVLPGWALVDLLGPRGTPLARAGAALAAGPLVSAALAAGLMATGSPLGHAAREAVQATAFVFLIAPVFGARLHREPEVSAPMPRAVWALAIGLAVAVALPPLLNPFIPLRGDSWTHGAITISAIEKGLPPEDPRFAGLALNYVWFYNLFTALLCGLTGRDPFGFMVVMNVATAFATVALVAAIARRLWRESHAATGAAALVVFGLNAGMWMLWPAHLGRALVGEVRGGLAVSQALTGLEIGHARVIYNLAAPYAHMVSFLDKLLVGSPLAYAWLLMILHLWALLGWTTHGRRADLAWMAVAAAGMMLFHGVVALSVIPVWIGTLAVAIPLRARLGWLPSAGRLAGALAATLAGAFAATPYLISVASGWAHEKTGVRHQYIAPDPVMIWTLVTACLFALWFARRGVADAWRERLPGATLVGGYALAMVIFACVVRLPENNQTKFVFQSFVPLVLLAAPAFAGRVERFLARRPGFAAALLGLVFVAPFALTLHGYAADPGRRSDPYMVEPAGERALNRWIRERTPANAIVVDRSFRDLASVRGRRALYLGTDKGPQWAAFPLDQVIERRRVTADLYGPAPDLAADARALARFGRPVLVVFRPEDDRETGAAWAAVRADTSRFATVYDAAGYRVARLRAGSRS
jgi:hypothetical protein